MDNISLSTSYYNIINKICIHIPLIIVCFYYLVCKLDVFNIIIDILILSGIYILYHKSSICIFMIHCIIISVTLKYYSVISFTTSYNFIIRSAISFCNIYSIIACSCINEVSSLTSGDGVIAYRTNKIIISACSYYLFITTCNIHSNISSSLTTFTIRNCIIKCYIFMFTIIHLL